MNYALRFSSLAILLLSSVFSTNPAWSKELTRAYDRTKDDPNWESEQRETKASPQKTVSKDISLAHNQGILPYLPGDIHKVNKLAVGTWCDEVGMPTSAHQGSCLAYVSDSTQTKWRLRFDGQGMVVRIFKIVGNDRLVLHWSPDFASPEARKYAESGGSHQNMRQGTQADKANTPLQQQQEHQAPMQEPRTDCERFSGLSQIPQRIACEAIGRR